MQPLSPEDVYWCRRRLGEPMLKMMIDQGPNVVVAGGFIRSCVSGETIMDTDVFSPSKEQAKAFADSFVSISTHKKVHENANCYTVNMLFGPVQFIHRWTFERPEDIIASFDFTIARAALWWDGKEWQSLCDDRFYADLAAKRLVYCSPVRVEDAGGSLLRVLKFYQRGYRITLDSLAAVIARIQGGVQEPEIDVESPREPQVAAQVLKLLCEVDPQPDPDGKIRAAVVQQALEQ